MNWDRVGREDRAIRHGTEPVSHGLPTPRSLRKSFKKSRRGGNKGAFVPPQQKLSATKRKQREKTSDKRAGLGPSTAKSGFDKDLQEIVGTDGWIHIDEIVEDLARRGVTRGDSSPVESVHVVSRIKARRRVFELRGTSVRKRRKSVYRVKRR